MGTESDLKKRVSNLESIGRKICSDLRNFQKERIILSREAKCLLREIEKKELRERRYNKRKHGNNAACACAIWEQDLIKYDGSEPEEISELQKEDEQILKCGNSCECCGCINEEDYCEDLFDIRKCSMYKLNELGEPFINDDDDDSLCFDKDNITKDNINYIYGTTRSCEACTIDATEFCDVCDFCKGNKSNIDNRCDMQDLTERQRGGGGKSDSESTNDESTNISSCTCDCDICGLRNKNGENPPCCLRGKEQQDHSIDIDYNENLQLNETVASELSEIHQHCKITKLREALEKLKNRNHTLRKLLKKQNCFITNSMMEQANYKLCQSTSDHNDNNNAGKDMKCFQDECKETPRELTAILKILQSKCRTKDGMIVALADELKDCATNERIKRILDKLTDPNVQCDIIDFDRSTLLKYLVSKQFDPIEQQNSCKRRSIVNKKAQFNEVTIGVVILSFIFVANIYYRYRCTAMFVFRTTCETFYRVYGILLSFQQCFTSNQIMIFLIKSCVDSFETFLSLFNCRQLSASVENMTNDLISISDDAFSWLSTMFIFTIIFFLFFYRSCSPFITMCNESLQHICNTYRNIAVNGCE